MRTLPRNNMHMYAALAALAPTVDDPPPKVLRCDPTLDDRTPSTGTAVCSICGTRLSAEDIGGGRPGEPYRPLPVCKGPKSI